MRPKAGTDKPTGDRVVKDTRRKTRKNHGEEEKLRIVLDVCVAGRASLDLGRNRLLSCSNRAKWRFGEDEVDRI